MQILSLFLFKPAKALPEAKCSGNEGSVKMSVPKQKFRENIDLPQAYVSYRLLFPENDR